MGINVEEQTVIVEGVRTHFRKTGSGPPMVLLHGMVGSARNWEHNMEYLGRFRTVYALDHANMGQTQRVRGLDPGLEASAHRVSATMAALGIGRADLVGHSHGGAIAMMLAAIEPTRVSRLILFAPANPYCGRGLPLIHFYQKPLGILVARLMPLVPRTFHRKALRKMYVDPSRIADSTFAGYRSQLDSGCIRHVLGIVRSWDSDMAALDRAIPTLRGLPVLLIWGEQDLAVGAESAPRLAEALGAKLVVLPQTGHVAFAENPETCHQIIGQWLGEV